MSDSPLRDLDVRRNAILTKEHAFVWASAGTGKTHTLTLRALFLLLDQAYPHLYRARTHAERRKQANSVIRSLVLTTFTRKAAAEMHERLYAYLDTVSQAASLEELRSSALARKDPIFIEIAEITLERLSSGDFSDLSLASQALAESASELQISTIHSLAASILKRHPVEAGIHPGTRFAKEDEEDVNVLKEQLLEGWWQKEAFGDPNNARDLATILQLIPVPELRHCLDLSYQTPWLADQLKEFSPPRKCEKTLECLETLVDILKVVNTGRVPQVLTALQSYVARVRAEEKGGWTQLARFLYDQKDYLFLKGKHTPKAVHRAICALPLVCQKPFETYLSTYSQALRAAIHFENGEIWEASTRLLGRFSEWAKSAATEELGIISFDDMINRTVALLKSSAEVRRFEFRRLRALLVDEFQDTDPTQLELISNLLRRPSDCSHEVLGFFVGDTKQSIYRFRGVDVLSVKGFFQNYESLTNPLQPKREFYLQTNFRSCASVTDFANHFFRKSLKLAGPSDELIPFRRDEAPLANWIQLTSEDPGTAVTAEGNRQLAAEATAAIIGDLVQREKGSTSFKDILILTRYNRELDSLLPILQSAGIPVATSGARTYFQQHEVLDLLNLLIALYHPSDTLAAAAVLRSPLIDLSDNEIHRLREIVPPERLFHSDDTIPDFIPTDSNYRICEMRRLAATRRSSSIYDWLHEVQSFIPSALYTRPHDSEGRAIVRMNRLIRAFREESLNGNSPPVVWLLKQRSRAGSVDRWDEDCGEDVNLSDEGVDAVRAMTIHKAKGLESPIVIIYSWSSLLEESLRSVNGFRGQKLELTIADGSRLQAMSFQWGPLRIVTDNFLEAARLDSRYTSKEAIRLAYVAVTRACDRLVLLQTPSRMIDTEFIQTIRSESPPVQFSEWTPREGIAKQRPPAPVTLNLPSYRQHWNRCRSSFEAAQPMLRHPTDLDFHPPSVLRDGYSAGSSMATGRLVHAYLERKLTGDFDKFLFEELVRQLDTQESDSSAHRQAELILRDFFSGSTMDRSGLPLSERLQQCTVLGQEIPVFLTIGGQAWHGVIDLIIEEADSLSAIDFKTGSFTGPLPETYLQQELVYGEALRRLYPARETHFEFWWLGTGSR